MPRNFEQQTPLKIYNSLTRKKEIFSPLVQGRVGMYLCGPTVYSPVHLGNLRTFIFFDVVRRYIEHGLGYRVKLIRNITDLGHEEFEEETSKMEKQAKLEQKDPMEIAQKYTFGFREICTLFSISPPNVEPLATGHIPEQMEIIQQLKSAGYAYESQGSIYFDVAAYNQQHPQTPYGMLSGNRTEEIKPQASQRDLTGIEEKKNSFDFALWKKANPQHIMRWKFPEKLTRADREFKGFPGWHMECSSMSLKYLGEQFDIHAGGLDLKFPHHECEIAQSIATTGKTPARYWMHSNMLTLNGKKMSKSEKNVIYPLDLIRGIFDDKKEIQGAFSRNAIRLFMLMAHYRSILDITQKGLEDAEKIENVLAASFRPEQEDNREEISQKKTSPQLKAKIAQWRQSCFDSMNDDFNTPKLVSRLLEIRKIHALFEGKNAPCEISLEDENSLAATYRLFLCDILGILPEENAVSKKSDTEMKSYAQLVGALENWRLEARKEKNWGVADKIRELLEKQNVTIQDKKIE